MIKLKFLHLLHTHCLLAVGDGDSLLCVDSDGVGIGALPGSYKLNVNGNTNLNGDVNVTGTFTAASFSGDGRNLSNLNIPASGWTNIIGGIYNTSLNNVGLGTVTPRYNVEIGPVGATNTTLYVNGNSEFTESISVKDVTISGDLTVSNHTITDINSGKVATSKLGILVDPTKPFQVGTDTVIESDGSVGIGTNSPQAKLEVNGDAIFKSYSEKVSSPDIGGAIAALDLSKANTFTFTPNRNVDMFEILNVPTDSTTFTIRIKNPGNYTVNIDTFVMVW